MAVVQQSKQGTGAEILRLIREGAVRGEKGEKGDSYVLTEADKAEIAAIVLADMPQGADVPLYGNSVEVV